MFMNVTAIIPARYASTRFPGKLLAKQTGKFVIQHVYEQVIQARRIDRTIIAVDDPRIADACSNFGADWIMTRSDHTCGTDRLAEVAENITTDLIINVQGDEPELPPENIDTLVQLMCDQTDAGMGTLISQIDNPDDINNLNIVKVVINNQGKALYFSRCPIPFNRDNAPFNRQYYKHIGIYAYRRDVLMMFSKLPPAPLEQMEKLEQLRALENGISIAVAKVQHTASGIDTPEQYQDFLTRWQATSA